MHRGGAGTVHVGIRTSNMVRSLDQLKPREQGVVASLKGMGAIQQRLCEMGVIDGTPVEVLRHALPACQRFRVALVELVEKGTAPRQRFGVVLDLIEHALALLGARSCRSA